MDQWTGDLAALEEAFGLPKGFIDGLKNDDDWSLVIKSHALIESACSDMLCHYFGKYELADIFSQLEMSNKRTGKIAFISALGLLSKKERRFISELSELRNLIVHNASNTVFSLQSYIHGLSKEKQIKTISALNLRTERVIIGERKIEGIHLGLEVPQMIIWGSLMDTLSSIYVQDVFAIKRSELISEHLEEIIKTGPIEIKHEEIPKSINPRNMRKFVR